MDLPIPYQFAPRAVGESIYSPDGKEYFQLPKSLFGRLSRRAQLVLGAIKEYAEQTTATNARDKDLANKTGLHLRTIQRALQDLEKVSVEAIKRIRGGGLRVIELATKLLDTKPDEKEPEKKTSAPTSGKKAKEPDREPSAVETRRKAVEAFIESMAFHGKAPQLVGRDLQWEPIPGAEQRDLHPALESKLELYAADVRRLLERTRPARE
jgi:DNA-binding transcriptional regulator YhcF (GntR family)